MALQTVRPAGLGLVTPTSWRKGTIPKNGYQTWSNLKIQTIGEN